MKAWATGDCDDGGDEWEQEIRLAEQAVQAINKLNPKPKFFVLCGDLVHAMPGKTRAVAVTQAFQIQFVLNWSSGFCHPSPYPHTNMFPL